MNAWTIEQTDFSNDIINKHMESLFTQGNGYIGIRGDSQLSDQVYQRGTYINGFYESGPIRYGEKAFGYAQNWQTIIPLPEAKDLKLIVNGRELFTGEGRFEKRKRILNLSESSSLWDFIWVDAEGNKYKGSLKIIIPFKYRGVVIFDWDIALPFEQSEISIESPLLFETSDKDENNDPRLPGHFNPGTLKVSTGLNEDLKHIMSIETEGSSLYMACSMDHQYQGISDDSSITTKSPRGLVEITKGKADRRIQILKSVAYAYNSTDKSNETESTILNELDDVRKNGLTIIESHQKEFMEHFWFRSDVEIMGDDEAQLSLRYNLFQLLQSVGRDGKRSIAAKGLSGSGYEGHYFWDAETYILPFFIYTNPDIAHAMLSYRISIISAAKQRAELLRHKGILFPWRTINGDECSAYFPAGTAQYHINSDIALGLVRYLEVTGDKTILEDGGSTLLAETARFWADFGTSVPEKGFCFNTVTGPDEYTAMVDNNYYTNISAKENLKAASFWLKGFVSLEELNLWEEKASEVFLPPLGSVTPQDDTFLNKKAWDFEETQKDHYPLLLHFHPLNIYRRRVLKQADVILAQSLFPSELPLEQKKLNFDYYEQLTTRDSSLSACAQGINAFWIGYDDLAWEYFKETLHTDRKDLHGNVSHGLHTASMGGSYLMVINGFLGLENFKGTILFKPRLPEHLTKLTLKILIGEALLKIEMDSHEIRYEAHNEDLIFYHLEQKVELKKYNSITLPTIKSEKKDFKLFRPRT